MTSIDIYRGDSAYVSIKPDENSVQAKTVMGENEIRLIFTHHSYINFKINDWCTVYDEKYVLTALAPVRKLSRILYEYNLVMQSESFELARGQYLFLGADNSLRETNFSLHGKLEDFIDLVISNISRASPNWTKGEVVSTDYKTLTFSQKNCMEALAQIVEAFDTEYWIDGKQINALTRGRDTGLVFEQGKNRGLYEIIRQNISDAPLATRVYGYGAEKNLPDTYGSSRLQMPIAGAQYLVSSITWEHTSTYPPPYQTITFYFIPPLDFSISHLRIEWRTVGGSDADWWYKDVSTPSPQQIGWLGAWEAKEVRIRSFDAEGNSWVTPIFTVSEDNDVPIFVNRIAYIDRDPLSFGVIELSKIYDDIFPHRTGAVTAIDPASEFHFIDTEIDFDLNNQLLPGLEPKVTFNTGQLGGYTFKISQFDNNTKEFTILKNEEETALDVPSPDMKPAIGDEYVLIDIKMPDSYVTEAEETLYNKVFADILILCYPRVSYTVVLDPLFLKRTGKRFALGEQVWIVDDDMEINRKIRIISFMRSLLAEYQYELTLADELVETSTISRMQNEQNRTANDLGQLTTRVNRQPINNNNVVGTLTFHQMPETDTQTGYSQIVVDNATGKIYAYRP